MTRKQLWLAIFVLLVAALVAATARWIVWPKTDAAPEHADAVVVLGGGGSERLDEGLKLVDEGVAQVLVISDGNRPGWQQANELCTKGDPGFAVVCFEPEPHRTQGEAAGVAELARERRWKNIVVVTSDYHAVRAGWLFDRCFDYDVPVVGAGNGLPRPTTVLHEWGAYVHGALLERHC
jgi:uncharacterized SAM-binding protein YcdF (DUF218 family)